MQRFAQRLDGAAHVAHIALFVGHAQQDLRLRLELLPHVFEKVGTAGIDEHRHRLVGRQAAAGLVHHRQHHAGRLVVEPVRQAGARQLYLEAGGQCIVGAHRRHGVLQAGHGRAVVARPVEQERVRIGVARLVARRRAQRAFEVADHAGGLQQLAARHQRPDQADVVFGIAKRRVARPGDDLAERRLGHGHVAGGQRELAQRAQALDNVRRDGHRVGQHALGQCRLAARRETVRQQIVSGHQARVGRQQFFEDRAGVVRLAQRKQRARQAQGRPADRAFGQHVAVHGGRLGMFAQRRVQFGAHTREVGGKARLRPRAVGACGDCFAQPALRRQLPGREQGAAPVEGALDARADQVDRKWFEEVVGRRQFGGADDLVALGLGREHDENGRGRDQAMLAQVFQQLLAVLAFAGAAGQVVFAQDDVEGALLQLTDGRAGVDRVFDLRDAGQAQHVLQAGAHARIRIDHQHCQVRVFLHRRSRRSCLSWPRAPDGAHRKIVQR